MTSKLKHRERLHERNREVNSEISKDKRLES